MAKWFVLENDEVSGPYSTEELDKLLSSGKLSSSLLVWGRSLDCWKPLNWWREELPQLLTKIAEPKDEQRWHYSIESVVHGPLKRSELIDELKQLEEVSKALVWTTSMQDWVPIYQVSDLLDELGVSRRKHPRAEISGQVVVTKGDQEHIAKLEMISAGGCGISGLQGVEVGEDLPIKICSSEFYKDLRARAQIKYITSQGYIGLNFTSINSEEKGAIINYIRSCLKASQKAA